MTQYNLNGTTILPIQQDETADIARSGTKILRPITIPILIFQTMLLSLTSCVMY